jgi:peptidoglycan/LPS O-acetylase OafA/YrhL
MYIAKFTPVIYGTNREIYTVLSILISLVLAEISYRFIENNFRSTEHKNA